MDKLIPTFMISLIFLLFGCSKDEDSCDNLSSNIVGKWEMSFDNSIVEFKSDGTVIDPNESLIGGEANGSDLTDKTYKVDGMQLTIRAEESGGGQFISVELDVTESTCDKITMSFIGIPVTMDRR